MGKARCLEISDYAGDTSQHPPAYAESEMVQLNKKTPSLSKPSFAIWSYSLRACYRLPREINVRDRKRSMEFIITVFYIFKCHHGDEMRLKHYAGILVIEF